MAQWLVISVKLAGYQNVGNPGEFPMKFHGNSLRNYQNLAGWKIPKIQMQVSSWEKHL